MTTLRRDALELIHRQAASLPMTDATVQRMHAMTRGQIWDAGKYKEKDGDISAPRNGCAPPTGTSGATTAAMRRCACPGAPARTP